jgi:hypothetical protein
MPATNVTRCNVHKLFVSVLTDSYIYNYSGIEPNHSMTKVTGKAELDVCSATAFGRLILRRFPGPLRCSRPNSHAMSRLLQLLHGFFSPSHFSFRPYNQDRLVIPFFCQRLAYLDRNCRLSVSSIWGVWSFWRYYRTWHNPMTIVSSFSGLENFHVQCPSAADPVTLCDRWMKSLGLSQELTTE